MLAAAGAPSTDDYSTGQARQRETSRRNLLHTKESKELTQWTLLLNAFLCVNSSDRGAQRAPANRPAVRAARTVGPTLNIPERSGWIAGSSESPLGPDQGTPMDQEGGVASVAAVVLHRPAVTGGCVGWRSPAGLQQPAPEKV